MSIGVFPRDPQRERSLVLQWVLLGSLIVIEGALISARFDAAPLEEGVPRWWAGILGQVGVLVPLGIALWTATVLFAGTRLRRELMAAVLADHGCSRWPLLVGHLAAFAVFFYLTAVVFEGSLDDGSALPAVWAVVWLLAGVATLATWALTILPAAVLPTVARRLGPILPVSIAVGIAAWGAGDITASWWDALQHSTLWAVHGLLAPVIPDLIFEPGQHLIGTDQFLIEITQKCAGYEGMGLMAVFLGAYLWLFRQTLRFPHALLLLPIGLCLAWWANVVRIAALVGIGTWASEAIAVGGFHAYSGSILYCSLALGLAYASQRVRFFAADAVPAAAFVRTDATAAYLAPLLALVATGMVTGMFTTDAIDSYYPLRVLVAIGVLWWFHPVYGDLRFTWSWEAAGIGAAVFLLWALLAPTPDPTPGPPWPADLTRGATAAWFGIRLIGAVLIVPLAEELVFRGYLLRRLVDADFRSVGAAQFSWLAVLGSSLLFGVMHERLIAGTLTGMCYAFAFYRRGNLADAVLAHAVTNAVLAIYVLATGHWWLWN